MSVLRAAPGPPGGSALLCLSPAAWGWAGTPPTKGRKGRRPLMEEPPSKRAGLKQLELGQASWGASDKGGWARRG